MREKCKYSEIRIATQIVWSRELQLYLHVLASTFILITNKHSIILKLLLLGLDSLCVSVVHYWREFMFEVEGCDSCEAFIRWRCLCQHVQFCFVQFCLSLQFWQLLRACSGKITIVTLPPEMSHIATRSLFGVQPLSQRGCHISILAFQRNQFLQSFLHQKNILFTHTKSLYHE